LPVVLYECETWSLTLREERKLRVFENMVLRRIFGPRMVVSGLPVSPGSPDTTLAEPHPNSNTQQTKNETANVVVQQHSRKLPKTGILMPEDGHINARNMLSL